MKKAEIVQLFSLIDKINTDDLVDNARICIVRNYMLLASIVDELEKYKLKVAEKLITKEFKELQTNDNRDEKEELRFKELNESLNKEFIDIINPILSEDCEINIKKINEEDFDNIIKVCTFSNAQFNYLHNMIVDEK